MAAHRRPTGSVRYELAYTGQHRRRRAGCGRRTRRSWLGHILGRHSSYCTTVNLSRTARPRLGAGGRAVELGGAECGAARPRRLRPARSRGICRGGSAARACRARPGEPDGRSGARQRPQRRRHLERGGARVAHAPRQERRAPPRSRGRAPRARGPPSMRCSCNCATHTPRPSPSRPRSVRNDISGCPVRLLPLACPVPGTYSSCPRGADPVYLPTRARPERVRGRRDERRGTNACGCWSLEARGTSAA
jgi:hypothetical protein